MSGEKRKLLQRPWAVALVSGDCPYSGSSSVLSRLLFGKDGCGHPNNANLLCNREYCPIRAHKTAKQKGTKKRRAGGNWL